MKIFPRESKTRVQQLRKLFTFMRAFFIVWLLSIPFYAGGQDVVFRNSLDLAYPPVSTEKQIIADSTKYVFDYMVHYIPDTTDINKVYTDLYKLAIGRRSTRFYSQIEYLHDSLTTAWGKYGRPDDYMEQSRALRRYHPLYWEITENRLQNTLNTTYRYPSNPPVFYTCQTDKEKIEWKLKQNMRVICGYQCFQASATFGGRAWMVYFTPDLPFENSIWKFSGLPGLVLAFEDTQGHYRFECIAIHTCDRPMTEYKKPLKQISRHRLNELVKHVHTDPLNTLEYGNTVYYQPNSTEPAQRLSYWAIPYNPIELE